MKKFKANKAISNKPRTGKKIRGFTLIELLVVVTVLAALAGITSVSLNGYQEEAAEQLTRVEMQRISNAIRRFKADTGYWPKTETEGGTATGSYGNDEDDEDDEVNYGGIDAANFYFLFSKPDENMQDWTPEYAIGWHGPYIDLSATKTIITDEFNVDDSGDPKPKGCVDGDTGGYPSSTFIHSEASDIENTILYGLVDRFEKVRQDSSGNVKVPGETYCILTKKESEYVDESGNKIWLWDIEDISASPYLYETDFSHDEFDLCDSDNTVDCIVLRSFGPDGIDGYAENAKDEDRYDDIIFVLEVNADLGEDENS